MPLITQDCSQTSLFDCMMWLTVTLLCLLIYLVKPFVELTKTPKLVNKPFYNIMLIYKQKKRSRDGNNSISAPYLIKLNT